MAASGDLISTVEHLARDSAGLTVTANLAVTVDGIDLAISTVDDRLRVQVPSVLAGIRLLRRERGRLRGLSQVLVEADLTAEIRVGSAVIAVAGRDATPGLSARLLSVDGVEVHSLALVLAALRLR